MPTLWSDTIATHRRAVRQAILDTTASLVAQRGLRVVTMSEIAERTGIGRATLYKYFPDIEAILLAWHRQQITRHLQQLAAVEAAASDPGARLQAMLRAYAQIAQESRSHQDRDLAAFLHQDEQVSHAAHQVHEMFRSLLAECARAGVVRGDVAPAELANYCLHALGAAGSLSSTVAVRRLVSLTLAGLRQSS